MKKSQITYLLIILTFLLSNGLFAQTIDSRSIEVSFAQSRINFDPENGELSNVLKIKNHTNTEVDVQVKVFMSEGWSLIFATPEKLTLKPNGETAYLTLDIAVPDETAGGTMHRLMAQVLTSEGKFINSAVCGVTVPKISSWKIWPEKNEVYIPSESKMIPIKILLKNTGNVEEVLNVKFQQHPNLIIARGVRKGLKLMPGQDTTLIYDAYYLPSSTFIQKLSIRFQASPTGSKKIEKSFITFLFLESEYDNFDKKSKNISTEVFAGTMNAENDLNAGMRSSGTISTGKNSQLNYQVESRDLLDPTKENTQHYIQYEGKNLKLESRNQIVKATYEKEESSFEKWSIGATQNMKNGSTQLEYEQQKMVKDTRVNGSLNYFNDPQSDRQTAIVDLSTDIPVHQKGRLYLSLQDILVKDDNSENPYKSNAYRYFLRYEGNYSLKWRTLLQSSYSSPHYSFGMKGVFQLRGQAIYQSLDQKHRMIAEAGMAQKSPKTYEKGMLQAPNSYSRNRVSLNYSYVFLPQIRVELGGLFEQYQAQRYASLIGETLPFQMETTELSLTASYKKYFMMKVKHRQRSIADFVSTSNLYQYENLPEFKTTTVQSRIQMNAFSLNYHFQQSDDLGTYLSDTLNHTKANHMGHAVDFMYQTRWTRAGLKFYSERGSNRLIVPVHIQGDLFRRSLKWKVSANAVHLFGAQTTTFFARAIADWRFSKGWHLLLKGQFFQKHQVANIENPESTQTQNAKFELGLKKNFHFDPLSGKVHDISIQCYKDENGNGLFDGTEEPMPDVRLHLSPLVDSLFPENDFREAAVFSAADGHAQFKNLPRGAYQLSVHQIFPDEDGYFNTTSESRRIDLLDDKDLQLSFGKGKAIEGKITLKRDDNSSYERLPLKGIRVTAVSPTGRVFSALTNKQGKFTLFVPFSEYYIVKTKNPYGEDFELAQGSQKVVFSEDAALPFVEFLIEEAAVEIEWE